MPSLNRAWIVDALRWTGSFLAVLSAYALVGWYLLAHPVPAQDQGGGEPAIEIDLQPAPATAPEPPNEAPPGPAQPQPESQAQDATEKPVEKLEEDKPKPENKQSEVNLPPPEKPHLEQRAAQAPPAEAPPPTAPDSVEAPPGPPVPSMPGQAEKPPSRAVLTWQRLLVSRLERAKRYPAHGDGREGATTVSFTIDPAGRLLSSRIVRSSGSSAFDTATLDLLSRSQPFPAPPKALTREQLSFVVTIRYAK